jgi:hypothetical protein
LFGELIMNTVASEVGLLMLSLLSQVAAAQSAVHEVLEKKALVFGALLESEALDRTFGFEVSE